MITVQFNTARMIRSFVGYMPALAEYYRIIRLVVRIRDTARCHCPSRQVNSILLNALYFNSVSVEGDSADFAWWNDKSEADLS
jgi:hypothetical protein